MQHSFYGRLYREPQVVGRFEVATPPGANDQSTGIVAVLGTSAGGLGVNQLAALRQLTGHACYQFANTGQATAILRSGNALRLIGKAFVPSPSQPGAQMVKYIRISSCTQAVLDLKDANANDVLTLTHRDAGAWGEQVRVKVETGTGSVGKKVTVQYASDDEQVGDLLTRPMLSVICADGGATAATITIVPITTGGVAGTIATTVTGAGKSAADLSISLATYSTIQQVADFINLQPYYKAIVLDGHGGDPSTWLDAATAQSIWCYTTMDGAPAAGSTVVPCAATSGMTVGDYVLLVDDNTATNTEVVRIGSIDTGVSFTLDANYSPLGLLYTYTSGAYVYADGTPRVGDLYAVYRWINDNVDEIVATREVGASEGTLPPTNIAYTYLAGGSDGTADLTTLADALTALQDEDVNFILVESENAAWHAAVKAHCLSTDNFSPRQLVCGGAAGESIAARKTRAYNLNSDAAYLVAEGHYDYTITGESTELLSPMYSAALVAGVAAGLEVQDPPTRKAINCIGIENNYEKADREDFINAGCITFRRLPSGFVITQAVSTVQTNLQLWDRAGNQTCEMSLARIRNQFMHEFLLDADALVPGANPRRLTKGCVETLVVSHLSAAVRKGWFAAVAPDAQHPLGQPAYDTPVIYKELDAWYVELSVRFANPNNFLFLLMKVIG